MKVMVILFLFLASPVVWGQSRVEIIQDLQVVLNKIKELQESKACTAEESLAVFDLDDTLLTSHQGEKFNQYQEMVTSGRCEQLGELENDNFSFYYDKEINKIRRYLKVHQTQSGLGDLLGQIQKLLPTLALTARYGMHQKATQTQFNLNGLDFSSPFPGISFSLDRKDLIPFNLNLSPEWKKLFDEKKIELSFLAHKGLFVPLGAPTGEVHLVPDFSIQFPAEDNFLKFLENQSLEFILWPPSSLLSAAQVEGAKTQKYDKLYSLGAGDEALKLNVAPPSLFPLIYKNGVIYTSGQNKGVILKTLLEQQKHKVKCLFFVDDSWARIQEMEAAFPPESGYLLFSFYYTRIGAH